MCLLLFFRWFCYFGDVAKEKNMKMKLLYNLCRRGWLLDGE